MEGGTIAMTQAQYGYLVGYVIMAVLIVGLLIALVREIARTDRWKRRAYDARKELAAATSRVGDMRKQRDALADGRRAFRAIEPADMEAWTGGVPPSWQ